VPTTADATLRLSRGRLSRGSRVDAVLVQPNTSRRSPWSAEDGFAEFERFLEVLTRIMNDGRLAVLTASMRAYGPPRDPPDFGTKEQAYFDDPGEYSMSLAYTLPGSAIVALTTLRADCQPSVPKQWGLLFGARRLIGELASAAGVSRFAESIPLPRDNRVFRDLLARAPDRQVASPYGQGVEVERKMLTFGIGQRMGDMHNRWTFDEDAHEGNFFMSDGRVVRVDFARSFVAYRPPTALQAATTLMPLLSSFSRVDWYWFMQGYVATRRENALEVIGLIDPSSVRVRRSPEERPES
jgi:hypothetical protein